LITRFCVLSYFRKTEKPERVNFLGGNTMKKRILASLLAAIMLASCLAGCGTTTPAAPQETAAPAASEESTETAEAVAEVAPIVKDETKTYSIDDEYEPWVWEVAVNNENFRKAIFFGINRASTYYVATGDEEISKTYMQNTVTPAGFAASENGTEYTEFPAFTEVTANDYFQPDNAISYRDAAMAELAEQGVQFPVKVLVRYRPSTDNWEQQSVVLEQQLEAVLNTDGVDFIDICVVAGPDDNFLTSTRRSCKYMLQLCNWGADYADPETYAEPFYQALKASSPNGYDRGGRYAYMAYAITDEMASAATVQEYFNLVEAASAITTDSEARYAAFAEAEAYLIDHALIVPYGLEVASYVVSRINPYEGQYASFGISQNRYKGQHLLDAPMSMEQYTAAVNGEEITNYTDTDNDTYSILYSGEMSTLNYLITGTTSEQAIGANTVDSLVEYNKDGEVQPSLANSWNYDAETKTWTFNLRDDATWIDNNGEFVANVTANDFVSAAKYVLDPAMDSSTANIIYDVIANAEAYYEYMSCAANAAAGVVEEDGTTYAIDEAGVVTITAADGTATTVEPVSFEDVGVKAVDDYTLQYTLEKDVPYFLSMLTYVTFFPAYGPQLEELGTSFATSAETMYYNGAYYISDYQPQVTLVMSKNDSNWDAEHVYIETISRIYNAEAATIGPEMAKRGEVDYASLDADVADAWLADPETAAMVSMERPDLQYSYFYCFNFNVYQLDDTYYRP